MVIKKDKNTGKGKVPSQRLDLEAYRDAAVEQLRQGKALLGEGGLLRPLIQDFLEAALRAEMDDHLASEAQQGKTNKRNGKQSKGVRTPAGMLQIDYSRDRAGSFEPVTVAKRSHELAAGFEDQILELYAMSNSVADISLHLRNLYGAQMSESRISTVISGVWQRVEAWKNRPLAACLVVLFCDAVHISVRREGVVKKVAVYVLYGIGLEGKREIIDLVVGQGGESATEWGRCLQQLKRRGLEDVLYVCTDGLAGLKDQIEAAFVLASQQRCLVHKMRNSLLLIDDKDKRQASQQLKAIYTAVNEAEARLKLEDFKTYWGDKYAHVAYLWEKDWTELMHCLDLSPALRKIIYTTNAIENLNREIRRVTKSKGAWSSDRALLIQLFLSLERKRDSWHKTVRGWASIRRELIRLHGERVTKHLF